MTVGFVVFVAPSLMCCNGLLRVSPGGTGFRLSVQKQD